MAEEIRRIIKDHARLPIEVGELAADADLAELRPATRPS
jgi:hypothetical protein